MSHVLGKTMPPQAGLTLRLGKQRLMQEELCSLLRCWSETSYRMQELRDHPDCARQEWAQLQDLEDPGLHCPSPTTVLGTAPPAFIQRRPRMAILREQGVNGHYELAAAFDRAGFECLDLHMSDLLAEPARLEDFQAVAAGGGFSYGDVLGAGTGWAKTLLCHPRLRDSFGAFFDRPDTLTIGICNGCQMISHLRELIPGSESWPQFLPNRSRQYESRIVMVEVLESPCVFTAGMAGLQLPVVVAHGEGRACFGQPDPGRHRP